MKRPIRWGYIGLCAVTLLVLGLAAFRCVTEESFLAEAVPVDAYLSDIVTEKDTGPVAYVWYLVDGVEYNVPLAGYSNSLLDEHGGLTVWYLPDEPSYCRLPSPDGYRLLFALGVALLAACVAVPIVRKRRMAKTKEPEPPEA